MMSPKLGIGIFQASSFPKHKILLILCLAYFPLHNVFNVSSSFFFFNSPLLRYN